ncbi:MAG TPA: TonB-dependent receptor [Polyangiaceae bacterium]|nr:TonB-dependent receptor [Polyangiaceae bacterium]
MSYRLPFAAFVLTLFVGSEARAESPSELDELLGQSIVSTPSKGAETDTTAPATSTVITAEQLRRYGIRSLDEAIDYLSLGMVTSTPNHTAEVGARGVLLNGDYGNHVLLLVDGHTMNEPWNGTAYFERGAGVPFEMIDHIEVILGPGSVLYGSQAMLGVINIVTKRAKDFSGLRVIAEGDASLPPQKADGPKSPGFTQSLGGGYRFAAGYGREFSIGKSPSELTLGLDYYANRGPTWQVGPQQYGDDYITYMPKNFGPKTPPGTWGGLIRDADSMQVPSAYLRFATGDFKAAVHASTYHRSTAFPDSLAAYAADFDDPVNREVDRFLNIDLSQRLALSSRLDVLVRGYGDLYDYQWYNRTSSAEDCPADFIEGCHRYLKGVGRTLGGEVRATLQWPILRAATLFGVDAKVRDVEDSLIIQNAAGTASVPPSGGHRTDGLVGPYVAQTLSPTNFLDINLGLRLDHDTRFGDKLSPRTALGVTPWDGGRVKLIYAEAFRAPAAYELTYADPNSQLASPNLGPETVRSLEGSFEQRFGKHRIMFGVFRSWWTDLVDAAPLSSAGIDAGIAEGKLTPGLEDAYQNQNLARVDNVGMNAGYDGAAVNGRLRFGTNVTIARTHVNEGDGGGELEMPVAAQVFGNARAAYDLGGSLPTIALAARFQGRRLADRYYDGGFTTSPVSPATVATRLVLTGPFAPVPGLSYRVGGEYSFSRTQPYVIGALLYPVDETSRAELAPTRRAQVFVGLEYAFEH